MQLDKMIIREHSELLIANHVRGGRFHMKGRPQSGFAIALSGRYIYTQDGRNFVSDPSNLLILPEGGVYDLTCEETGTCLLINFSAENGPERIETLPIADNERYAAMMQRLTAGTDAVSRMRNFALLYEIFAVLAAENEGRQEIHPSCDISRSVAFMEANFSDPALSLPRIAAESSISTVYFRKLFTTAYGVSPIRWLRELRMTHAKQLLAERECSIAEIAAACGYSDIYSFSNAFKKTAGMPPTAYVKNLLQF